MAPARMRRVMSLNSDGSTVIHRAVATTTPPAIAGHLHNAPEFIADAATADIPGVADFRRPSAAGGWRSQPLGRRKKRRKHKQLVFRFEFAPLLPPACPRCGPGRTNPLCSSPFLRSSCELGSLRILRCRSRRVLGCRSLRDLRLRSLRHLLLHDRISGCAIARFGRTGWQVSEIGYGMWGMGGWTGSDDEESLRALDRAFALGCNFFDTAWAYGDGKSETAARRGAARAHRGRGCTSPPRSRRRT